MKHWLIYILSLLLFSCEKKPDDGVVSISLEERDSLLLAYILKEFDYDFDSAYHERSKRHFEEQLDQLRKDTTLNRDSFGSHEGKFKNYRLKSFIFDDQRRPPFVVEIINKEHQFISFFSFTDETYYRGNSIDTRNWVKRSLERDSVLQQKVNLENNLNHLIEKLSLNSKDEIFDLTKKICQVLNMKQISQDSIEKEIVAIYVNSDAALNDSTYTLVKKEQETFFQKGAGAILMVRTQSYLGYWKFWIEENEGRLLIRTAFFSDILYTPIYM